MLNKWQWCLKVVIITCFAMFISVSGFVLIAQGDKQILYVPIGILMLFGPFKYIFYIYWGNEKDWRI